MKSINDFRNNLADARGRKVIGVLSKNENNKLSVGCMFCDAEFLALDTFDSHLMEKHNCDINPRFKPTQNKFFEVLSSDEEDQSFSLLSDDEENPNASQSTQELLKRQKIDEPNKKTSLLRAHRNISANINKNLNAQANGDNEPQISTSCSITNGHSISGNQKSSSKNTSKRNAISDCNKNHSKLLKPNTTTACDVQIKYETIDDAESMLKCQYCSKQLTKPLLFDRHIWECEMVPKNNKCKYCFRVFATSQSKRIHIVNNHKIELPHSCEHCYAAYRSKKELHAHFQRRHPNENMESSGVSGAEFDTGKQKREHTKTTTRLD